MMFVPLAPENPLLAGPFPLVYPEIPVVPLKQTETGQIVEC